MKIGNRKAALTALVLITAVLLCLGALVYQAKVTKLNGLIKQRNAKRQGLRGLQSKLASRPVLERKFAGLQQCLSVLEPNLATYAYIPTFLRQIEKLALETDNKVAGVKPLPLIARTPAAPAPTTEEGAGGKKTGKQQPAAPKEPAVVKLYDRVPIEFNLNGDYWQTVAFLERLAKFPKMLAVDDISLTPASQAQGLTAPQLRVRMNLLALIQKGEEKWTSDAKNSSS